MSGSAGERLRKADEAIAAAEYLLDGGFVDIAGGRAYYAMFYTAEALLAEMELGFSKHSAVHAAFGREFAKPGLIDATFHRWLTVAFKHRAEGDYGEAGSLDRDVVTEMIRQAREFLLAARTYLDRQSRTGEQDG